MRGVLLASSLFLASCAHTKDATVCPDSRDLPCLTAPQCAPDPARGGCLVCRCAPAMNTSVTAPTGPTPAP